VPCQPGSLCRLRALFLTDTSSSRIYQLEKSAHQSSTGDAESRPLIRNEEPEEAFSRALGVELEKISSFYVSKEGELFEEVNQLLKDIGAQAEGGEEHGFDGRSPTAVRRARPASSYSRNSAEDGAEDSDDDDDDDETTGLTRSKASFGRRRTMPSMMHASTDMTASSELTRSVRRYSTTIDDYEQTLLYSSDIMLKKRIIGLYVQLCELKSFIQLNKTGFRKVLKKFDKILDKELRPKYMEGQVEPAYPFKPETLSTLEEHIGQLEEAYSVVVTQGDMELAKKDLRSHLREHVVWERNTVWRDMIGLERRAEAASVGRTLLGTDMVAGIRRLQGDDDVVPTTKEIITPVGRFTCPTWLVSSTMLTLIVTIALFFLLLWLPLMEKPEQQNCLALLVFVSLLWATEVSMTSLPLSSPPCSIH
jgi:phosphate transporter